MSKRHPLVHFAVSRWRRSVAIGMFVICLGAAVAATVIARGVTRNRSALRASGILAAKQAEYVEAVELLGGYLQHQPRDADALYYYGVARRHVLALGGEHLRNAIATLKRCCLVDPRHALAWRELATAYLATNSPHTALSAARRAKSFAPADHDAACLLVACLLSDGHDAVADGELDRAMQIHPDSPQLHLLRLTQMAAAGCGKEAIREYAKELTEAHGGEPWTILVATAAHLINRDRMAAQALLPQVLGRTLDESGPHFARTLVALIKETDQHDVGLTLLASSEASLRDEYLRLWAVRRSWDLRRPGWILKHVPTEELNLATNPETAFYRVIALRAAGRKRQTNELVARLARDVPTEAARRWHRLCRLAASTTPPDPAETIDVTKKVLRISPKCPIVHRIRAHAWAQLGEYDLARRSATTAMDLAPAWHVPASFLGEPSKSYSSPADASEQLERRRVPTTIAGWETMLRKVPNDYEILALALETGSPLQNTGLEKFLIDRLEAVSPQEATGWRLLQARYLLGTDKSERAAAKVVLTLRPVLDAIATHGDARMLRAVALARLHDHERSENDLLVAVEADHRRAIDALRVALKCREDGRWSDSAGMVEVWVRITKTEASLRKAASATDAVAAGDVPEQPSGGPSVKHRLLTLAEYAEQTRDVELAEATYRRLLQLDPMLHVACNNLAVILGRRPGCVDEARTLAHRAVAASPDNHEYRETLETILSVK